MNHGGVKETLVELRSEYWVPKGRHLVKKTLHQCVICKKLEGLPYKASKRADLPEIRVTDVPAFTHVGVDFTGLLFTKTTRGTAKTYICLFICATSRAIHLERLSDLSSEAFIRGLQRFAGRRGTPASSLHNVRQRQNVQASQQRPRPTIKSQESPRFCHQQRHHLELHSRESRRGGEDIMNV